MLPIVARFYRTASGEKPVWDWLKRMDRRDRQTIGSDIATADGISMVRSIIVDGTVEARTYFAVEGKTMRLLHGESGEEVYGADVGHFEMTLPDREASESTGLPGIQLRIISGLQGGS